MTEPILARKQRFLKNKELYGSIEELFKVNQIRPYKLYFTSDGEIMCLTREDIDIQPGWLTYDFDKQQLFDLKYFEKDLHKYKVVPIGKSSYKIILKPIETLFKESEKKDLVLIDVNEELDNYELKLEITDHEIIFSLSPDALAKYGTKYSISTTVKGKRIFHFYFTLKGSDTSFIHKATISMVELLESEKLIKYPPADLRQYDVLTIPLFDKYIRINS